MANLSTTVVPGGGFVVDEKTVTSISNALNAIQSVGAGSASLPLAAQVPKAVMLPYSFSPGDRYLVIGAQKSGGFFFLPRAGSVPAGYSVTIQGSSAPFSVSSATGDSISGIAGNTVPIGSSLGSSSSATFTSNGTNTWFPQTSLDASSTASALNAANQILSSLQNTVNGLPTTFVSSITESATETGAITFAGSAVSQSGATFNFFPFGPTKAEVLPYVYTAGDTFLILTPNGGNTTFTLPAANSVPNGFTIFIRNASTSTAMTVNRAGADTFNGTGTSFPMTTLGNAFSGATFTSDGVSAWWTIATAG